MNEIALEMVKIALAALAGFWLSNHRDHKARRSDAWRTWTDLNLATRSGNRSELQAKLGLFEFAMHQAGVNDRLVQVFKKNAWLYYRWWSIAPHGFPAPNTFHEMHQEAVDLLRVRLKRPVKWYLNPKLASREKELSQKGGELGLQFETFVERYEQHRDEIPELIHGALQDINTKSPSSEEE